MRFLVPLALALTTGLATGSASASQAASCSRAAAKAAVLSSSLPKRWKDLAREIYGGPSGGSIAGVICRDVTRDGRVDITLTFYSGGTAGEVAWVVFRRVGERWQLALKRLDAYKLTVRVHGGDPVETQPVYLAGDANCCPTGGFDHVRFHWNGKRFVVTRAWHTKQYAP